jgi:hypothetical protein
LLEQTFELVAAAVGVADDVERSAVLFPVVPEWLTLDDSRIDFVLGLKDVDVAETLSPEAPQRAMQLALLIADDVRTEVAVRPRSIPIVADALWQVQDDGDG